MDIISINGVCPAGLLYQVAVGIIMIGNPTVSRLFGCETVPAVIGIAGFDPVRFLTDTVSGLVITVLIYCLSVIRPDGFLYKTVCPVIIICGFSLTAGSAFRGLRPLPVFPEGICILCYNRTVPVNGFL